jgi:hypothetical protein
MSLESMSVSSNAASEAVSAAGIRVSDSRNWSARLSFPCTAPVMATGASTPWSAA